MEFLSTSGVSCRDKQKKRGEERTIGREVEKEKAAKRGKDERQEKKQKRGKEGLLYELEALSLR